MKNVSHHAVQRINQRGNNVINTSNKSLSKNAKKNGISASEYVKKFGQTPLVKYINYKIKKYPKSKIYLYLNYIFCFSASGNLITLYPFPDKFKNEVALNQNRNKYRMNTREFVFSKVKKNGNWTLYVTENNKEKKIGDFDTETEALRYGAEYFFLNPVGTKYFEENKEGCAKEFSNYLVENKFLRVVSNVPVKEMPKIKEEKVYLKPVIINDSEFEETIEESKYINIVAEKEVINEEINNSNDNIKTFKKADKETSKEILFKAFVLEDNNYKCIKDSANKRSAIAEITNYYKDTAWYNRFLKHKSKEFKEKNNKNFYNFLNSLGVAIILDIRLGSPMYAWQSLVYCTSLEN